MTFCPPDVSDVDDADLVECLRYDPEAEVEVLRSLPEVVGADRAAVRTGLVRANGRASARPVFISAMLDPGGITPVGRPVLLEGTLASADAPDEVMVNEAFVRTYGVGLGDQLLLRAFTPGEDDRTRPPTCAVRSWPCASWASFGPSKTSAHSTAAARPAWPPPSSPGPVSTSA